MRVTEIPAKSKEQKIIRVAAYARVSSDKDAAFHSLEAQTEYYEKYVAAHPDWGLVRIYSDNGISGTIINRPAFQQMLEDCRAGKIDLVVTKSVTRFARNTVILLETIRELKKLGIDCYFEKEDMHSISPDGELLLTLLAMYAEEEARSASENQLWRIRKRFEQGKPWVGNMLGYRLIDGELIVIPEEAEIVKRIFDLFLSGLGANAIAKALEEAGVPAKNSSRWSRSTIGKILRNEHYKGDARFQKTYREDFRTKKDLDNHGKRRQYYVENCHEPIIDRETFDKVQEEIARRKRKFNPKESDYKPQHYLFSGLIRCGICGRMYGRRHSNTGKYKKAVWVCNQTFERGKAACPSIRIPEEVLIDKAKEALRISELTHKVIADRISEILVIDRHCLRFVMKDGGAVDTQWEHRSRKESWTPEMRQAMGDRVQKRYGKEDRHA